MKESRHDKIRVLLLNSSDGLTTTQIAQQLGSTYKSIQKTMNNIYGVYIDRWDVPRRGQFAAVWMCVDVLMYHTPQTGTYLSQQPCGRTTHHTKNCNEETRDDYPAT